MSDRFAALDEVFRLADSLGIVVEEFKLDGQWHRVPVVGKKRSNSSGAYCLSELVLRSGKVAVVGMLFNWATQLEERLTLDGVEGATAEEIAEAKRRAREAAEAAKRAKAELQRETAQRAADIWNKLPAEGRAPYLQNKGVKAWGVRFSRGSIVIPARDVEGKIWTLQFINPQGDKRFLTGGAKRGRFHLITRPPVEGRALPSSLGIAEGYATGASIHEALNIDVAITFDAGNILPVAQALKGIYPDRRFIFFADHDAHNGYPQAFIKQSEASPAVRKQVARLAMVRPDVLIEIVADDDSRLIECQKNPDIYYNTGVAKAVLAAAAVDGDVLIPHFNNNQEDRREQQ